MTKITNRGRILGSLLRSPKTTAELSRGRGYVNNGIPRYAVIYKELKTLEECRYIESERLKLQKLGNFPSLYSIVLNIQNLRRIYNECPYLIGNIQRNELALETIFFGCLDVFYIYTDIEMREIEAIKSLIEADKENLIKKLRSSTKLLRIFLMSENMRLRHRLISIAKDADKKVQSEIFVMENNPDKRIIRLESIYGLEKLYEACTIADKERKLLKKEEGSMWLR